MSSYRLALALLVAGMLAGCSVRPMYGNSGGETNVSDIMASVDVSPIPGRVGQRVRNDLVFKTTGGGRSLAPRYRLEIAVREAVQGVMVNRSGDEAGKVYSLTADFKLLTIADNITDGDDDNPVLLEGKSHAKAAFNQQKSIFSNMRGRVDAENRAAAVIADNIKTRIAAFLAR